MLYIRDRLINVKKRENIYLFSSMFSILNFMPKSLK